MNVLFVCLKIKTTILLYLILCLCFSMHGQIKWDGEAGDGQWNTAANWVGNIIPTLGNDVLLDHAFVTGNYIVTLPSGISAVNIKSLIINPADAQTIEVVLPVSNTAVPGFTAIGSMYGLEINRGGIFRNSSGASAGTPVEISDSIKIENGGLYIHHTSRAHANNVTVLSRAPGTEQGNFEFDVPGGSGYTVSIAGRVYGNMILSAAAAGGTKSYTSTGVTTVNINGDFTIRAGVNYSLNFNGAFIIHGNFIHQGNIFDVSGGTYSNHISIRKNLSQAGTITESGTGSPVIAFEGTINQDILITGNIIQNNTVRINNSAGITLRTAFSVHHKLELTRGNIRTTPVNILILHDNTTATGGSVGSFVDGPMRKVGDDNFEFPVGKQGDYAPLIITGTGGNQSDQFETEYSHGNPAMIFGTSIESPPIIRNSSLEYWKMERLVGTSSKKISLSVRTYSNATLLEKLVVSRWDIPGSIWRNEGNTAYSGIAAGTITSRDIHSFGVFTIASTVAEQNPLPLIPITIHAGIQNENVLLTWQIDPALEAENFEVLRSGSSAHFDIVEKIKAFPSEIKYQFSERLNATGVYNYKVRLTTKDGKVWYSRVLSVSYKHSGLQLIISSPLINYRNPTLTVLGSAKAMVKIYVFSVEGKIVFKFSTAVNNGSVSFPLNLSMMAAGTYYVSGIAGGTRLNVIRIVKL